MDYQSLLRAYPSFHCNNEGVYPHLSYASRNCYNKNVDDLEKVKDIFGFDNDVAVGATNEIEKICYLKNIVIHALNWNGVDITDRKYDNMSYLDIIITAKQNGDALNCRYKSFVYSQLLSLFGFKARWVGCLPMDADDEECHCLTEVFLPELNKWIAVDVSFDYLYFDSNGKMLNIAEIRRNLILGKKVRFISKNRQGTLDTIRYLEKNFFKFRFMEKYTYNSTIDSCQTILLCPSGYIVGEAERKKYSYVTNNISPFWKGYEDENNL